MNINADLPAVKIESINKTYMEKKCEINALNDFSCEIKTGEIVGLIGPNGAGKTTLLKIIMGLTAPDSGRILFNGKVKRFGEPRFKPGIKTGKTNKLNSSGINKISNTGYLPENFCPNPHITVKEYILFLFGLININSKVAKPKALYLLEQVGMENYANRRISDLSKGMGQRLGLAQAFVGDPDILLLDEPTSGLDPVGRSEVIEFLLDQKKKGKTIFFCSHILSEVEQVCDKIGILVKGRLKIFGQIKCLLSETENTNLEDVFKKMVQ